MKTKYQRMSKEEKKKTREKYYATPEGFLNQKRFQRLLLCGILCLLYSVITSIDCFIKQDSYWYYVLSGIVAIFGLIFLIGRYKLKHKILNKYVIKHK